MEHLKNLGFVVDVVEGFAADFQADVLMIKYAPSSQGFEARLRADLKKKGDSTLYDAKLAPGDYRLVKTPESYHSRYVLCVGTVNILDLGYGAIRKLGYDMLASLHAEGLAVQHVATTLHGVNTVKGNDEVEAFRSLLLGFADAYEADRIPAELQRITIVEREGYRAKLLQESLSKFILNTSLPVEGSVLQATRQVAEQVEKIIAGVESFDTPYQQPVADDHSPHIFVAMPFSDEFDDHYYLAIRPAITENKVLCIRLDQDESIFTGDIMEQVKKQIKGAKLLVALLDGRNPNVYLEVGYAWGVGVPTILVLHENEQPPFDVQGARLLYYNRMYKLKEQLADEIRKLLKHG